MSEPERPFLPMSWELGGEFMSGMADSIRERRAREVPGWKEGVVEDETTFEEAWQKMWEDEWEEEEDEWEDEEDKEEWEEEEWKLTEAIESLLPRLADFVVDVATIALVPTTLMLAAIALFQRTTFDFLETALMLGVTTAVALMIADVKQKLLQRLLQHLKQPKF
jgi:hypothetical protein